MYPDPDMQRKAAERMSRMREGDDVRAEERIVTKKDGTKISLSISSSVLKEENGQTHVLALMQVITQRKQAEETLRKSQVMLTSVLNSVPQSIFWKDRDSVYLGCNEVFARAVGLQSPDQIVGKTDFDLPWPREEAEAYRANDREVMASNKAKRHMIERLQQANYPYVFEDLRQSQRDACNRKGQIKNSLFDMETYETVKQCCLAY